MSAHPLNAADGGGYWLRLKSASEIRLHCRGSEGLRAGVTADSTHDAVPVAMSAEAPSAELLSHSRDIPHSMVSVDVFSSDPCTGIQPCDGDYEEEEAHVHAFDLADPYRCVQKVKRQRRKMRGTVKQCAPLLALEPSTMHDDVSVPCAESCNPPAPHSRDDDDAAAACAMNCCLDDVDIINRSPPDMDEPASLSFADLFSDILSSKRLQMSPD